MHVRRARARGHGARLAVQDDLHGELNRFGAGHEVLHHRPGHELRPKRHVPDVTCAPAQRATPGDLQHVARSESNSQN